MYYCNFSDYLKNTAKSKTVISNQDKLETLTLPQYQLSPILSRIHAGREHDNASKKLAEANDARYDKWMLVMHKNENILLYGLGPKRDVLFNFFKKLLRNKFPTIVVNGLVPTLSIKDVLDGILKILEQKENCSNVYHACDLIEHEMYNNTDTHFYLIVHNIDKMNNKQSQEVLARLAKMKNIHFIVSIDHINALLGTFCGSQLNSVMQSTNNKSEKNMKLVYGKRH